MKYLSGLTIVILIVATSCQSKSKDVSDKTLMETALKICQDNIILDAHIDWPEKIYRDPADISKEKEKGDFDLIRANKGGLNAAMSVLYVPSGTSNEEGRTMVDSLFDLVTEYAIKYPDKFALARTPEEIIANHQKGVFSIPLCLENGAPIGNDLDYIEELQKRGITYITLCHFLSNQICDSNFNPNRQWSGLSPFGLEVIEKMNRLGIMIDISHSTDSTVFDVLQNSKAPICATHSSCRHFTPGLERNLSDTLIKAIADKNGVVMVAFVSDFLDSVICKNFDKLFKLMDSIGIGFSSKEGIEYLEEFAKTHKTRSNSKQLVDHIDHIVKLVGINHVGLGSDYDGMGPFQPSDLPDVSSYPVVVFELLTRGYTEEDISKILAKNFLRVWNEVIAVADTLNNISI